MSATGACARSAGDSFWRVLARTTAPAAGGTSADTHWLKALVLTARAGRYTLTG